MAVLRVHTIGDWHPADVRTRWVRSSHAPPPEVTELIESAWQRALQRPRVKLFDGPMCRMESWAVLGGASDAINGGLELVLSPTTYKAFMGTNMSHPELADRFGQGVLANPVGVSPALETSDGFLLMGRRNAAVAYYPSRLHPFAGSLEPRDAGDGELDGNGGPDLFAAVRRELGEELSFTPSDVADIRLTGIVEDVALRQPELIFRVSTPLNRSEVEARVARDEHLAAVAIPATPAGLEAVLRDPMVTPVGLASLLLWGRVSFGEDWFTKQAKVVNDTPPDQSLA